MILETPDGRKIFEWRDGDPMPTFVDPAGDEDDDEGQKEEEKPDEEEENAQD